MKLRLTARVESVGITAEPFGVETPPYVVELGCNEKGQVVEVRVEKQVDVSSVDLPSTTISDAQRVEIRTTTTDPHFEDVLDLVQFIESIGSFYLGVRRIHWQHAKYEWIPESEEERSKLTLFAVETRYEYPQTPVAIDPGTLFRLVRSRVRLDRYRIPMAFFREGVNDYRAFRYVTAYHNFYFFLEDLFGGGKTKNRHVLESFTSSADLVDAVRKTISELKTLGQARHRNKITVYMDAEGMDWTPIDVLRFLVHMRGNLHHFSKSSKPKAHPLNQLDFESVAYLIQMICYRVVAARVR